MEKKDILKLCIEKGFFLDRDMLEFFIGLKDVKKIILNLKNLNISEKILTKEIFNKYKNKLGYFSNEDNDIKILKDIKINYGKIETRDFIDYFRVRFEILRDILIKRDDLENLSSIRRLSLNNGIFYIVGMIFSKRITKNKNLLIEIEDLTGRIFILVNRENKQLFERAQNLLLDDVIAFKCSGSSKMLFASDFIYPDSCLNRENFGNKDEVIAFISDLHVGSKNFLEGNFMRFIDWLNGNIGDSRQKGLAQKVKYLILSGNNIEGVGIYSGQEKILKIKGCRGQYEKLAEILGKIRKDIKIVMIPGKHDAVWMGEPQPAINKKWGKYLNKMENLRMISNPSIIEICGLKILVYCGGNFNKFIDEIEYIRINYGYNCPTRVIEEILKRRHLAPIYGEMDIIPNKMEDNLVLDNLPDIFVIGGQNRAMIGNYNNILTISCSSFNNQVNFKINNDNNLNPCRVPILNLKSKEIKILDFSDNEVKWESGNNLICKLGGEI